MSATTAPVKVPVYPHTIPGILHQQNQSAFHWGWQGLLAYGYHSVVVVVEPRSVQPLQTLVHHKTNVVKVCWAPAVHHHTLSSPYCLKLASVDQSCVCVIWDITEGTVYTEFSLGSRTLVDLQWLAINDTCRDLLAVLVAPSTMTIWNTDTGTRVSRFTFTESIHTFLFNPFKTEELILQSTDCLIFINDFNPARNPTGGGKKFYLTSSDSTMPLPGRGKTPPYLQRRLVAGDQLKGEETIRFSENVQLVFSPAVHHCLFIIFSKEITVVDLEMQQAVGIIALERSASPFLQVLPCTQRDLLYCLHENGCVSVRVNHPLELPGNDSTLSPVGGAESREVRYVAHGHSEPLRISKSCQVYSGALCPVTEKQVAVLTSEGRILFWDCEFEQVGVYGQQLSKRAELYPTLLTAHPVRGVDLVSVGEEDEGYSGAGGQGISLADTVAPTWFTPPEGCTSTFGLLSLKLTLGRLWTGITSHPTVLRMSPPLTTRNWLTYTPLLAIGTSNGSVLIYNLAKRVMVKEFSVHSCPVHGIEWTSQTSLTSYGYTTPNSAGHVRNEVAFTDIRTGKLTFLKRPDVNNSQPQTPIDTVKISHQKNYVVVKYVNRPLEFYEARTGTFLREMVTNPPTFSCVDWTPNHNRHKTPRVDPLTLGKSSMAVDFDLAMGASDGRASQTSNKELLSVMDENGSTWQISIDGSKVKPTNPSPIQTWLNNPLSMTWKGDTMVAGDVNGVLVYHDAKAGHVKTVETPRAPIKKLRFAPGKGNTKLMVLYNSRIDIRDISTDTVLSQHKWGAKDHAIEDADWATSDKIVLLSSNGCVRVCEVTLKASQSPVNIRELADPIFCPPVLTPQCGLYLKCLLQHQPWRIEYSLDPEILSPDHPVEKFVQEQLKSLPDEYRHALLEARLGVPERCLLTARLYGDQQEISFWTVAQYYILREKHRRQYSLYSTSHKTHKRNPSDDIFQPDSEASVSIGPTHQHTPSLDDLLGPLAETEEGGESLGSLQTPPTSSFDDVDGDLRDAELRTLDETPPLDLTFDLLCDSKTYKRIALNRVLLFDSRRQTYNQTRRCAESLMLLGQTDRAVQMLLETDSSSNQYYTDALKACLAATIRSSGASQSTIKLVATNLIANSRLFEGIQLLCLIDKSQDSCRYLQTYGEWYYSAWLGKITLSERDCNEVFTRWAEHLASAGVNQKNMALLVYLSLGNFIKVIEMLYSMRCFDQATVFAEACLAQSLLPQTKATSALLEAVFLEYARYLHSLQLARGLRHYANKAGEKGAQLLQQLNPVRSIR